MQRRGDANASSLGTRTRADVFSLEGLERTWFYNESWRELAEGNDCRGLERSHFPKRAEYLGGVRPLIEAPNVCVGGGSSFKS